MDDTRQQRIYEADALEWAATAGLSQDALVELARKGDKRALLVLEHQERRNRAPLSKLERQSRADRIARRKLEHQERCQR